MFEPQQHLPFPQLLGGADLTHRKAAQHLRQLGGLQHPDGHRTHHPLAVCLRPLTKATGRLSKTDFALLQPNPEFPGQAGIPYPQERVDDRVTATGGTKKLLFQARGKQLLSKAPQGFWPAEVQVQIFWLPTAGQEKGIEGLISQQRLALFRQPVLWQGHKGSDLLFYLAAQQLGHQLQAAGKGLQLIRGKLGGAQLKHQPILAGARASILSRNNSSKAAFT